MSRFSTQFNIVTIENAKFYQILSLSVYRFSMNKLSGRESNKVQEKCSDGINSRHVQQEQSNKSEKSAICIFPTLLPRISIQSNTRLVILTVPHRSRSSRTNFFKKKWLIWVLYIPIKKFELSRSVHVL